MLPLSLDLLDTVKRIAIAAGELILEIYQRDFAVDYKPDYSPLTEADSQASALIIENLQISLGAVNILSEESAQYFNPETAMSEYFLVDPLDGTKEFIKKNGEFTVNIALIQQGKTVLGVVYAPVTGELYSAMQGHGAYKSMLGESQRIHVQPTHTPQRIMVSRSHLDNASQQFIQQFPKAISIPMGSSLKICKIAEGEADIYPRFGPTSLWDTAAAQAVLEQAGGALIDFTGNPLSYANPQQILNPNFIATGQNSVDLKHAG